MAFGCSDPEHSPRRGGQRPQMEVERAQGGAGVRVEAAAELVVRESGDGRATPLPPGAEEEAEDEGPYRLSELEAAASGSTEEAPVGETPPSEGAGVLGRLWVSAPGTLSPLHYDAQDSYLCQVRGEKRLLLWPAADLGALEPYPAEHAMARRLRVDVTGAGRPWPVRRARRRAGSARSPSYTRTKSKPCCSANDEKCSCTCRCVAAGASSHSHSVSGW